MLNRARCLLLGIVVASLVAAAGGVPAATGEGAAAAQEEPTLVLSPTSGPCDAPILVTGTGFAPPGDSIESPGLYLVEPGTADISMGSLNPAPVDQDGAFSQWVGLREHGCEAAALDSRAEQPSGHLIIAVGSPGRPVAPGERIPHIIATAEYQYTTTALPPEPIMVVSPAAGPCDAIVDVTGRDFPPNTAIRLDVARPGEGTLGKLVSLVTDPLGTFSVTLELGSLGCEAAAAFESLGGGSDELWIFADLEERTIVGPPPGIPPILTQTPYTYTTTAVSPQGLPQSLPQTGSRAGAKEETPGWLVLVGPLAGLGLVLVVASLYLRRKRT